MPILLQVLSIPSGSSYQISIYYKSKNIGKHSCPLQFEFKVGEEDTQVQMYKFLVAETKNPEIDELLPNEPYRRLNPRQISRHPQTEIVRGVPPSG